MKESDVAKFLATLERLYLPRPVREFAFHPTRGWRLDFAWPTRKIALEIEGGAFMKGGGRHTRGAGFREDLEKYNSATVLGWRILRALPEQLTKPELAEFVRAAIEGTS